MSLIVKTVCFLTGKKKWKKTCCLPSFVIFLFIFGCIIAGITLLALFRVDPKHLTVNAVLISVASMVGLAFVLNFRTWWQVLDSLLNSQRKRLHHAASKLHKLKSEGFMKVSFYWIIGNCNVNYGVATMFVRLWCCFCCVFGIAGR
jgi:hypothetical protein